jgi:hypothetical protein
MITFIFVIFLVTISVSNLGVAAPLLNESKNDDSIVLSYSFKKPVISINDGLCEIDLEDLKTSIRPGEPLLPIKDTRVLLSPNSAVSSITVIPGEKIELPGSYLLAHCQNPIPYVDDVPVKSISAKEEIYQSEKPYPGVIYEEVGLHKFRGYSIFYLNVFPVQYIPASGIIYYYPEIIVKIEVSKVENLDLYRGLPEDRVEVVNRVHNPDMVNQYSKIDPTDSVARKYDLLIITTKELRKGFIPLVKAHYMRGIRSAIRLLGYNIPISKDVNQTSANIREYIKNQYIRHNIKYVLIGGDLDIIPVQFLYAEANDSIPLGDGVHQTHMPSDLYYACLDGPFNFDGDNCWGEPEDGENGSDVDLLAEVYVGRACVGNISEVDIFVKKTLTYLFRNVNDDYLKDVLMVGEYLGGPPTYPLTLGGDYMDELINSSPNTASQNSLWKYCEGLSVEFGIKKP